MYEIAIAFFFGIAIGSLLTGWINRPKRDEKGRFRK